MTPEEIKMRLRERKVTQTKIADRCKVRTGAVNQVIQGRMSSRKIEEALPALSVSPWPNSARLGWSVLGRRYEVETNENSNR